MNPEFSLRRTIQTLIGLILLCMAAFLAERGDPNDQLRILLSGSGGLGLMVHAALGNMRKTLAVSPMSSRSLDPLDRVLLHWDLDNAFTVRDYLNGGVQILGRTGSGKTSSSGKALAGAIVGLARSGGTILCAKPEDRAMWEAIFSQAGRRDDLLIFAPDQPLRFNFLAYELNQGTRNLTRTLMTIGESLRTSDKSGREDSDFWEREQERLLFNAIEMVTLAMGPFSAPDLHRFISTAAMSPDDFHKDSWLDSFHNHVLRAAYESPKSPLEQHDYELARTYFESEWPMMADRTRSSILTGVMGILHVFNTGLVRELVSTTTNVTPDDLFAGKWVLVDMAPSEWGDVGRFVASGWKYLTQRAILRRVAGPNANVVTIWADEAQQSVTSFDAQFLAQCRSHQGCAVYLSQSLPGYYAALGGEKGRHSIDALLTNFHTKIFHALGDLETAEFASKLVGRSLQMFTGGTTTPAEGSFDELMGRSRYSGNYSQSFESTLQANAFLNHLRTGGPANHFLCDAYVIRSGEPFADGQPFLLTSFSQQG